MKGDIEKGAESGEGLIDDDCKRLREMYSYVDVVNFQFEITSKRDFAA